MRDLADELQQTDYDHPKAQIWVADALTAFQNGIGGTLVPHLYLKTLNLRAAPGIDSAEFEFRTGVQVFMDESTFTSNALLLSDVIGKAVKVLIPDTVNTSGPDQRDITWFGWLDTNVTDGVSQGTFTLNAAGVLIMAEHTEIHHAEVLGQSGAGSVRVGVGLPFNLDSADRFGTEGNRAATAVPAQAYLFSWASRGGSLWTSFTAVEYLLQYHAPLNYHGYPAPAWSYESTTWRDKPSDWYVCRCTTGGKTLKALLDELIPRKRAMSYYVSYDDTVQKVRLRIFTFVPDAIDVYVAEDGTVQQLPRNEDQVEITLRDSVWFVDHKLTESVDQQYDRIIARGERLTATCTLTFVAADKQFAPDWSTADESAYKNGVDTTDTEANGRFRSEDRYSHVYCRFRLSDEWNGRPRNELLGTEYWAFPALYLDRTPKALYDADTNPEGLPLRIPGLKLLRKLPLKERVDYSDDRIEEGDVAAQLVSLSAAGVTELEDVPPFFFVDANEGVDSKWVLLDKLATATEGADDKTKRRHWSVHCSLASTEPAVELRVSSGQQTLLALDSFTSPAPSGAYDIHWNPGEQNGIEFRDILATVCLEAEHQLEYSKDTGVVAVDRPLRILNLTVQDARRDYVVPDTIVRVNDGDLEYSASGGYVRDDMPRLVTIVSAAVEWYSRVKTAIEFTYKQPRRLVEIGTLITVTRAMQLTDEINTPVTSITYSLGSGQSAGTTRIETGFAEADFT